MSVFGFSKSFGIAGLRAGCVYTTNPELFEGIVENSDVMTTAGGIASICQIAAMTCMDKCYYWVDEFLQHLTGNRDYAVERLSKMPGLGLCPSGYLPAVCGYPGVRHDFRGIHRLHEGKGESGCGLRR